MRIEMVMGNALPEIDVESKAAERAVPLMDEETFRRFYERTSRGVWAYLSRMTGDRQLADDLLQETFYKFYRAGANYESETHRRNALFCIATNLARDAARKRRLADIVPIPEEMELRANDRTAAKVETRTDVRRALEQLKPAQREMLWLAYAQGASHNEIAEILGVKSASVKALLFRARQKMATLLRRESAS
jgi:RNA polymerase sigma-70 factor (ECF subfamily)